MELPPASFYSRPPVPPLLCPASSVATRHASVALQVIALIEPACTYLFSVHFNLFGGSVLKLGTQRHHDKYMAGIDDASFPGCFALTEVKAGVNSGFFIE